MPTQATVARKPVSVASKGVAPVEPPISADTQGKIIWTNQVDLTVHVKETHINGTQTFAWAKVFVGMGKDPTDPAGKKFKPSLWLKVKAFGSEDPALPALLAAYDPGAVVKIIGRLAYEETPGKGEGKKFKDVIVIAQSIDDPDHE